MWSIWLCESFVVFLSLISYSLFWESICCKPSGCGCPSARDGVVKLARFFTPKFNSLELEKKAFWLISALQHFEVYVRAGGLSVVHTDHNILTFLNSLWCPNQQLMRWSLFLQVYNLEIRLIKGKDNVIVGVLSHMPPQKLNHVISSFEIIPFILSLTSCFLLSSYSLHTVLLSRYQVADDGWGRFHLRLPLFLFLRLLSLILTYFCSVVKFR